MQFLSAYIPKYDVSPPCHVVQGRHNSVIFANYQLKIHKIIDVLTRFQNDSFLVLKFTHFCESSILESPENWACIGNNRQWPTATGELELLEVGSGYPRLLLHYTLHLSDLCHVTFYSFSQKSLKQNSGNCRTTYTSSSFY